MITDIGKGIVAKYLIGTAPAYASYLALGCGSRPRSNVNTISGASSVGTTITVSSTQGLWVGAQIKIVSGTGTLADEGNTLVTSIASGTDFTVNYEPQVALSGATLSIQPSSDIRSLDFEMFRVPVTSRGVTVNPDGTTTIIFTGQLPAEERYEITEVGLYSAGNNTSAGIYDSKTLYAFSENEPWEYHNSSTSISIPSVFSPLDPSNDDVIVQTSPVFQVAANNRTLANAQRLARYERPRFFNNVIMMRGDTADIGVSGSNLIINSGDHIHLNRPPFDVTRNSPADLLKLAFSVVNVDGQAGGDPDAVRIVMDFSTSDVTNGGEYARFEANVTNGVNVGEQDFGINRYFVITKQLQQLVKTSGFSWDAVTIVKIYVSVIKNGVPSDAYYVALDAFRLDNINTINVLYGLTGYSIVQNPNRTPIIKNQNTSNYVEFRIKGDVT